MDSSEQLVEKYLQELGLGEVVFEPDGNIPPDFSINKSIAIEVRRLNQNHESPDGSTQGLEEAALPLEQRLEKFLQTLGPSRTGESWFVGIEFHRPVGPWKPIRTQIERQLRAFMLEPNRAQTTFVITENVKIDLLKAGQDHGRFFLFGSSDDDDSGGWVMSEVVRNLRLCIAEKERKILPYRARYQEWWLLLVDHVAYSMDTDGRKVFRNEWMPKISHSFNKLIFLDPRDHRNAFVV